MVAAPKGSREEIIVCTYKYDGREHRRWRGQLVERQNTLIVLSAEFTKEIEHPLLGKIECGTLSIEYYWLNCWYNIFRFLHPSGELRNFYCNINVPPVFYRNVLGYIDLDLDILVEPDLSYTILDEDEFATNVGLFKYPLELQRQSYQAIEELIALIESCCYPFGHLR